VQETALAEEKANTLREQLRQLESEITQTQRDIAQRGSEKEQKNAELRTAYDTFAASDDERRRLLEELGEANRIQLSLNNDLMDAERQQAAFVEASASIRQRLQRLEDMQAALQTVVQDGESKRMESDFCIAPEANRHVAKSHEALRNGIMEQSSKVSMLEAEIGSSRSQKEIVAGDLNALSMKHAELRTEEEALRAQVGEVSERESALRSKLFELMSELESVRLKLKSAESARNELDFQIELHNNFSNAVSSTYHAEVDFVTPVLELTKVRKQEADATHVEKVQDILNAREAREGRASRDATLSDSAYSSKSCPAPSFLSKDVCPKLKTKEWYKVSPNSTGIFLPCPEATQYRSSDFSLWGRMVVGDEGRRKDVAKN
jgi:chromosome segregation ATPase